VVSVGDEGILEIPEAEGALEQVEAYLRHHGFFEDGGSRAGGRHAEVYLGYRLSELDRRSPRPARQEPLPLPAAACRIRRDDKLGPPTSGFDLGPWVPTWEPADHARAIDAARGAIAAGEVYQVNLVQHQSAPFAGDPWSVAAALDGLRPLHARPLVGAGWAIVSASPELFLARRGRRVWTMPIKGTRPRGEADDLRHSAKDAAEHVMIVDLERNDLGRICEPGSVSWPALMQARSLAGVEHLVSIVEGTLREALGFADTVGAMFPGGSVTGAPKVAALDQINALEPVGRGASMGALGTVWPNGDFDLALTIRTFAIGGGRIHLWVGGGIVWDSDAAAEITESWVKARPLLDALAAAAGTAVAA
jgi:para-aminobenzoate synthetase component 1